MDFSSRGLLRALLMPGGLLLGAAAILLASGLLSPPVGAVDSYYLAVFAAGVLLAWRFRSSRVGFALIVLFLSHRAIAFFSGGHPSPVRSGHIAFDAVAFLLPLNFIVLSFTRETGWRVPDLLPRLILLFVESVFVAIICRPGAVHSPAFLRSAVLDADWFRWSTVSEVSLLVFATALGILLSRFLVYRKLLDGGLLWSLGASFLALQSGREPLMSAYLATGALILSSSIVENSYSLAYNDELTGLPGRRAFNESLLRLPELYCVAVVDIDHFKHFNDTYGHETGDQVLRMVARCLAQVSGGGQAFRVGGEEFTVLFPGVAVKDVANHLEQLRVAIENARFRVRGRPDRRSEPRGPDRRSDNRKKRSPSAPTPVSDCLSVTVSIGAAEPTTRIREVDAVIQAADKALYRAKRSGRNRLEIAGVSGSRVPRAKRGIA